MPLKNLFSCSCLQLDNNDEEYYRERSNRQQRPRFNQKLRTPNRIRVEAIGAIGLRDEEEIIDWDNEKRTITETELLYAGYARKWSMTPVPWDLIGVFTKFWFLSDEWCSNMIDFGLQISGESNDKIKMIHANQQVINYAFGERVIDIDPAVRIKKRVVWKLKLKTRQRKAHVCCGIGIIDVRNTKYVHHRNLKMISSNFPQILNAKKNEYRHLIGFQCGTFNEYTEEEEPSFRHLLELGLIIIRRRWKQNGHCINDAAAPKKLKAGDEGWTNPGCCFMNGDDVTVSVDHDKLRLDLFVDDKSKARYSKSIRHIEAGQYKLCVWLLFQKQSIQIMQ